MNPTKTLRTLRAAAIAAIAAIGTSMSFTACNETSEIGGSIVQDEVAVIVDSSFTATGHSVQNGAVLSRTVMQLLGVVDAPEYGYISSEVVTQFMPSLTLDTAGVTVETVDSLKLIFQINLGTWTGDSLAPVGLEVYPLIKQLETPIYSNFNPEGYYDSSKLLGSLIYNVSAVGQSDSIKNLKYRTLYVNLPRELAQDFYREYKENPATYASPTAFAKYFPGLYFKNSYGSGRITRVANTTMRMYYHRNLKTDDGRDSAVYKIGNYFAVTPEIISNNDIDLAIAPEILSRVDKGDCIMLAPAGLDVEMTFPAREIAAAYRAGVGNGLGVINTLSFVLPMDAIENKYDIAQPTDVLMILKKDLDKFFLENKVTDNITSFRATFEPLTNSYYFSDMRQYIVDIINKGDQVTADDYTFVLVPITVNVETNQDYYGNVTSYVTSITPYVTEPRMGLFRFDKAKINFVYSRQTTKI